VDCSGEKFRLNERTPKESLSDKKDNRGRKDPYFIYQWEADKGEERKKKGGRSQFV